MIICWFGIYRPEFGRNKVYMSGLQRLGHTVMECRDNSRGILKYWRLWKKHRTLTNSYDALVVGYPGHIITPFAALISAKPVILDALCTLYEGEVISRGKYRFNPCMRAWIRLVDWIAVKTADLVLVETEAQRKYFIERFSIPATKVSRVFTGVDEDFFYFDPQVQKQSVFTAVFRGRLLPEAGVRHIVRAAKLLEDIDVNILLLGSGHQEHEIEILMQDTQPKNITWTRDYLSNDEVRTKMLECHVSLGQFENHPRLERTIPHKAFEALRMNIPYITGRTSAIEELFTDGKNCLMVNLANPEDIAAKILMLKKDMFLADTIAANGQTLYMQRLASSVLAQEIVNLIIARKSHPQR